MLKHASADPWAGRRWQPGPPAAPTGVVLRRCACGGQAGPDGECEQCRRKRLSLQRKAGEAAPALAPPVVHQVLRSPGRPLDDAARSFVEPRFGHSFAAVRVHDDALAAESAAAVHAHAYTVGSHVVFAVGRYAPGTAAGLRLLTHELAHVVQQSGAGTGIVDRLPVGGPSDSAELEAARAAESGGSGAAVAGVNRGSGPFPLMLRRTRLGEPPYRDPLPCTTVYCGYADTKEECERCCWDTVPVTDPEYCYSQCLGLCASLPPGRRRRPEPPTMLPPRGRR